MVTHASNRDPRTLRIAIAWILFSCVSFACMWGVIRLASQHLHPFVLVFWRNVFGLTFLMPILMRDGLGWLRTARISLHLRRAASGVVATFSNFYAVANTPMATAISINYAAPLFATIGAVFLLGEKIRMRRIMALISGFSGVLIVVRPGQMPLTPGLIAAFIAVVSTAFSIIAVKHMTNTQDNRAIVFYSFALMVLPGFLVAWPVWAWPSGSQWVPVVLIGLFSMFGQYAMVRAYALADTGALMPYDFVRFLLVIAIGVAYFNERFDFFTFIGGMIILASTLYLAHRERVAAHSVKPTDTPKDIA